MRIELLELRLLRLPLVRAFETSFGHVDARTIVLVTVHAEGAAGWGESVAVADPHVVARIATLRPALPTPICLDESIDTRADGIVAVPSGPGIGVTIVPDSVDRATERRLVKSARAA